MAKRFADTNKYKKPFLRGLPGPYKLLWDFLCLDCDHAGIWIVDFEIAQTYVGADMPVNKLEALKLFNNGEDRIVEIDGGKKWFVPSFIDFQYGCLSEKNRAHASVILILRKLNLLNPDLTIKTQKPPISPLQGVKDKDMDKELEKDMDKEKDFGKSENLLREDLIIPQMAEVWKATFPKYTFNREKDYMALGDILRFMCESSGNHDPTGTDAQIVILNTLQLVADEVKKDSFWTNKPLKSIASHIQEFYNKIKNPVNGKAGKPKYDSGALQQKVAERYGNR
jgi:hypothetical protein